METESARELMHNLLMVHTSFRQAIQRSMKRNNIELTFEMLQIMVYLWRKDGVNQQELAISTFKDKASLSPLLNNLEAKKLVMRTADTNDKRNKKIYLTDQGNECGQRVKPMLTEIYASVSAQINLPQTELFIKYLHELNDAFKQA